MGPSDEDGEGPDDRRNCFTGNCLLHVRSSTPLEAMRPVGRDMSGSDEVMMVTVMRVTVEVKME
jgi:hypothetical protein